MATRKPETLDIPSKLANDFGLLPSEHWLKACQDHLRLVNQDTLENILKTVLNADLRDVVRPVENSIERKNESSKITPPVLMRKAIENSMTTETRKETLLTSFRLLVQVEELIDVSLNTESRCNLANNSPLKPTGAGSQRQRLLKMYFTDGHIPNSYLIAMETKPIPNITMNSHAGMKILLKGPLEIRHGMIQLNPTNAMAIGGRVDELVTIQRKALEQSRRLFGAGIDPTIKALCWNSNDAPHADIDEGELSSVDVIPPEIQSQVTNGTLSVFNLNSQKQIKDPVLSRSTLHRWNSENTCTDPRWEIVSTSTSLSTQEANAVTQTTRLSQSSRNTSDANIERVPILASTKSNPYNRSTIASISSKADLNKERLANATINDSIESNRNSSGMSNSSQDKTTAKLLLNSNETQSSQESLGRFREPLSFEEMVHLLYRITRDRSLYEKYQDHIFVIPAKMKGRHVYFNIEKRKKRGKGDDKYEYVMTSQFTGTMQPPQLLTVIVTDAILRPHFKLGPGEMRQLSREDRIASQKLVDEGGTSVIAELSTLRSWEVCLNVPAEEFFCKPILEIDQSQAILRLLKPSD
jgi:RecQ mediated genome instability protein